MDTEFVKLWDTLTIEPTKEQIQKFVKSCNALTTKIKENGNKPLYGEEDSYLSQEARNKMASLRKKTYEHSINDQ